MVKTWMVEVIALGAGVSLELVWIPGGTMGAQPITLSGFWLGRYPITQAQWQAVMGDNPSYFRGENRPVEQVPWGRAQEFCQILSERTGQRFGLPSEAQWEYACRAGSTTPYPFGEDLWQLTEYAWFWDNSNGETHPVGEKRPNAWGLYDMLGNVAEWCADTWRWDWEEGPTDGSPYQAEHPPLRVMRGGSWVHFYPFCSAIARSYNHINAASAGSNCGFRVMRESPATAE